MPARHNTQLRDVAYYRTGGKATLVLEPATVEELAADLAYVHARRMPYYFLGGGTNSLVLDETFAGAVVLLRGLTRLEPTPTGLVVGAGVDNSALAQFALEHGLGGIGWMNGLPGQVGGTVRMNARCYGGEVSQVVSHVRVVTPKGEIREYAGKNVFRGYKDTTLMGSGEAVAEVDFRLAAGNPDAIRAEMDRCRADRESKHQYDFPSCGCVFKNDYGIGLPSGMLLEAAGAKELTASGAAVSAYHANFVYNRGATSRAILELTLVMRDLVFEKFGAWLEYEMEILGDLPPDLAPRVLERRPHQLDEAALAPLRAKSGRRT